MIRMLEIASVAAGVIGLLVSIFSGLLRLSGRWTLFDFDLMTLFTVGIALVVAACFFKLQAMGIKRER